MKAIFLIGYSEGMGLTFHLASLAEALFKELHPHSIDFKLFSTDKEQNEGLIFKCVHQIGTDSCIFRPKPRELYDELESIIHKNNYTSVLICAQGPRQVQALAGIKKRNPSVVKIEVRINSYRNGSPLSWPTAFAQSLIYKMHCDCVNFQTLSTIGAWKTTSITTPTRSICIPLGMEPPEIIPCIESEIHKLEAGTFNITYLARFESGKQHAKMLHALIPIARRNPLLRVFLFGDGPLRLKVIDWIKKERLSHKIFCPGRIDRKHVPWVLSKTHCAIVASKNETFGHCIIEPLTCGVPVISTAVGVAPAVITDFNNGFLIKKCIMRELPEYLSILTGDNILLQNMRQAARESVSFYTWPKIAAAYRHLFHQLFPK